MIMQGYGTSTGLVPGAHSNTSICTCASPLEVGAVMVQCLHITYVHSPVYFKSYLDYLSYKIQCKYYVNSCYTILTRE
jgi:TctA family transporter